jgi:hypothetical protein
MKLLLLLVQLSAIAPLNAQLAVSPCGGTMTIQKASVTPTIPVANQQVKLHLEYSVPSPVSGGTSETAVTYNFIPFNPTVEPLCASIPCPLAPGAYSNDTSRAWPSGLSGNIAVTTKWFDPNHVLLLCFKLAGKVGSFANFSKAVAKRACRNKTACFRSPR